ncbi:hypothetical protein bcere0029_49070 [Bacillus cereus AH1272]|nr:hypothetical protein bcere0029_49070 [Bacillus cereus AH1272]EEL91131.1 hypothetical protein bcere0030_48960 [Bacillus cereus AH1273]
MEEGFFTDILWEFDKLIFGNGKMYVKLNNEESFITYFLQETIL